MQDHKMAEIGERIRTARRSKKLSQTNFGKIVGRSMNGMAMIERGEADPPVGLLMRIAEALEEDFEFLVTGRRKVRIISDLSIEEFQDLLITSRFDQPTLSKLELLAELKKVSDRLQEE